MRRPGPSLARSLTAQRTPAAARTLHKPWRRSMAKESMHCGSSLLTIRSTNGHRPSGRLQKDLGNPEPAALAWLSRLAPGLIGMSASLALDGMLTNTAGDAGE